MNPPPDPHCRHRFPAEIISHAVWLYHVFSLQWVSEAVRLRRDEVDIDQTRLWVRRLKSGLSVEQPIAGDELRAIKLLSWLPIRYAALLALRLGQPPAGHWLTRRGRRSQASASSKT